MKKLNSILLLLLALYVVPLHSQNLYDAEHSMKFANYLYDNGEYNFAAKEYYRLFVLYDHNDTIAGKLGNSLFRSQQYEAITNTFNTAYESSGIPCSIADIYTKSLIISSPMHISSEWINNNQCLTYDEISYYVMTNMLLHHRFDEATARYNSDADNILMQDYQDIIRRIETARYKKVWASVLMSAIIPGTGKAYCGYWKDGLFSFIMFGLSSWQAYSGFNKKGVNSVYGWINGGLALAFYSGNIYGSIKSANQHNYQIDHNIYHDAQKVFLLPD